MCVVERGWMLRCIIVAKPIVHDSSSEIDPIHHLFVGRVGGAAEIPTTVVNTTTIIMIYITVDLLLEKDLLEKGWCDATKTATTTRLESHVTPEEEGMGRSERIWRKQGFWFVHEKSWDDTPNPYNPWLATGWLLALCPSRPQFPCCRGRGRGPPPSTTIARLLSTLRHTRPEDKNSEHGCDHARRRAGFPQTRECGCSTCMRT